MQHANTKERAPEPLAYRVPEVSSLLQLSEATVWRMIRDGEIEARKARGATLITRDAMQAYLASCPVIAPQRKDAQS